MEEKKITRGSLTGQILDLFLNDHEFESPNSVSFKIYMIVNFSICEINRNMRL